MLNRKSERADAALQQLVEMKIDAELVICDLSSFTSVREAITTLLQKYVNGIDVLCNNAGIMVRGYLDISATLYVLTL